MGLAICHSEINQGFILTAHEQATMNYLDDGIIMKTEVMQQTWGNYNIQ